MVPKFFCIGNFFFHFTSHSNIHGYCGECFPSKEADCLILDTHSLICFVSFMTTKNWVLTPPVCHGSTVWKHCSRVRRIVLSKQRKPRVIWKMSHWQVNNCLEMSSQSFLNSHVAIQLCCHNLLYIPRGNFGCWSSPWGKGTENTVGDCLATAADSVIQWRS